MNIRYKLNLTNKVKWLISIIIKTEVQYKQ